MQTYLTWGDLPRGDGDALPDHPGLSASAALANVASPAPLAEAGQVAAGEPAKLMLALLGLAATGAVVLATVPMLRRHAELHAM